MRRMIGAGDAADNLRSGREGEAGRWGSRALTFARPVASPTLQGRGAGCDCVHARARVNIRPTTHKAAIT